MKYLCLLYFIFFLTNSGFAAANLPASTMKDLEIFSKKSLNKKDNLEEVKKNIEILLILESEDPSRTAVLMLSESYNKNSEIYEKAMQSLENSANKKTLDEIRTILKNFHKKGNG